MSISSSDYPSGQFPSLPPEPKKDTAKEKPTATTPAESTVSQKEEQSAVESPPHPLSNPALQKQTEAQTQKQFITTSSAVNATSTVGSVENAEKLSPKESNTAAKAVISKIPPEDEAKDNQTDVGTQKNIKTKAEGQKDIKKAAKTSSVDVPVTKETAEKILVKFKEESQAIIFEDPACIVDRACQDYLFQKGIPIAKSSNADQWTIDSVKKNLEAIAAVQSDETVSGYFNGLLATCEEEIKGLVDEYDKAISRGVITGEGEKKSLEELISGSIPPEEHLFFSLGSYTSPHHIWPRPILDARKNNETVLNVIIDPTYYHYSNESILASLKKTHFEGQDDIELAKMIDGCSLKKLACQFPYASQPKETLNPGAWTDKDRVDDFHRNWEAYLTKCLIAGKTIYLSDFIDGRPSGEIIKIYSKLKEKFPDRLFLMLGHYGYGAIANGPVTDQQILDAYTFDEKQRESMKDLFHYLPKSEETFSDESLTVANLKKWSAKKK